MGNRQVEFAIRIGEMEAVYRVPGVDLDAMYDELRPSCFLGMDAETEALSKAREQIQVALSSPILRALICVAGVPFHPPRKGRVYLTFDSEGELVGAEEDIKVETID